MYYADNLINPSSKKSKNEPKNTEGVKDLAAICANVSGISKLSLNDLIGQLIMLFRNYQKN
jgi:hypothetical protein